jgi:hypothetical protein
MRCTRTKTSTEGSGLATILRYRFFLGCIFPNKALRSYLQKFFYADASIEKSHHLINTKSGSTENNREVIDAPELRLVFHYKYPKTISDHA